MRARALVVCGLFSFLATMGTAMGADDAPLPPTVYVSKPEATYVTPYERSGVLMVFRTFDRVSFALVLEADRTMRIKDRIAAPAG